MFDVANDHGLHTSLMSGKTKFSLYRDSYDAKHGAASTVTPDCGHNKIDLFCLRQGLCIHDGEVPRCHAREAVPIRVSALCRSGRRRPSTRLGKRCLPASHPQSRCPIGANFPRIESSPELRGKTTIFLTSDHGGKDHNHANNLLPEVYTIPVYVWGCGAAVGKDLYALNRLRVAILGRASAAHRSRTTDRNGEGANLALKLLGLGPVPGSTINVRQDLAIGP